MFSESFLFPKSTFPEASGLHFLYKIVPPNSANSPQFDQVKGLSDSSKITLYKDVFEKRKNEDLSIMATANFGSGASSDFLGFARFSSCLQTPLLVKNGYSCGSVPSEMNLMGRNLFEYAIDVKIMMHAYQAIYTTGNVISKTDIAQCVLKREVSYYDRSIDMHISNIRKKIAETTAETKIKTVRGVGYVFLQG